MNCRNLDIIGQDTMDWYLANTNIRVHKEDQLRNSKAGYLVSFDPSPVIINLDTTEQIDYSNFTTEDYFEGKEATETQE